MLPDRSPVCVGSRGSGPRRLRVSRPTLGASTTVCPLQGPAAQARAPAAHRATAGRGGHSRLDEASRRLSRPIQSATDDGTVGTRERCAYPGSRAFLFCVSSLLRKTTVPYKGACSTQLFFIRFHRIRFFVLNRLKSAPVSWFKWFPEATRSCPRCWLFVGYHRATITNKIGPGPQVCKVWAYPLLPYRGQGLACDRSTRPYFFWNPGVVISRIPALLGR